MRRCYIHLAAGSLAFAAAVLAGCGGPEREIEANLREHVLFYSNFEKGVDALYSAGSPLADIDGAHTRHQLTGGKADGMDEGYVMFEKDAGALSYAAKGNFSYKADASWSGSVSFWLGVAPGELEADFPEPFHIGKRDGNAFPWDDAVIFLDFTKPPRALRFGCYPDKTRDISDEMVEQRTISVENLNWKTNEWHHIAIAWSNFNSGKADAEWALFVDGEEKGRKKNLIQDITWDLSNQVIRFNHYKFAGRMDNIAVFNKMLTPAEAKYLARPKKEMNSLLKKD